MNSRVIVDLCNDDEAGQVNVKGVILEPASGGVTVLQKSHDIAQSAENWKSKPRPRKQESEENKIPNALSTGQSSTSELEQGQSPVDDTGISTSTTSSIYRVSLCRQFWKAGNYDEGLGSKIPRENGKNYLHVHPMFLHSNATSHQWAFGAIAELLDNVVDEIQNGATSVIIDKTTNPRDGSPALLIQDDGGGMDPEAMRHCISFGFSDKKSKSAIGKYGNGFKTSTMRLGADVILFSRQRDNRTVTQSIGLLSYTFLTQTGHDRIVVPMVDYEFNTSTGTLNILHDREHFATNLSMLLQWSPYSTEAELLKQFDNIGPHGTKIVIYNLWLNDDGNLELDFASDPEDICISGDVKRMFRPIDDQHIANQFHFSLRVYLSILYLRVHESFSIVLCGKVVEHHNIAKDLKFPQFIVYRPQSAGSVVEVITTIGFLKEAPNVSFHGFNVYHKNRLILPFWQVVSYSANRGRGVVGVLEADFIEPAHNKQDFERTSLFQKLEVRLKEMTWEYWDFHCGLIGYYAKKKPRQSVSPQVTSRSTPCSSMEPVRLDQSSAAAGRAKQSVPNCTNSQVPTKQRSHKRKEHGDLPQIQKGKTQTGKVADALDAGQNFETQPVSTTRNPSRDQEAVKLLERNKMLHAQCLEYEKREKELKLKVKELGSELKKYECEFDRLFAELEAPNAVKEKRGVKMKM